jgi:hypothetical protein
MFGFRKKKAQREKPNLSPRDLEQEITGVYQTASVKIVRLYPSPQEHLLLIHIKKLFVPIALAHIQNKGLTLLFVQILKNLDQESKSTQDEGCLRLIHRIKVLIWLTSWENPNSVEILEQKFQDICEEYQLNE